jgi:hypothetical protein
MSRKSHILDFVRTLAKLRDLEDPEIRGLGEAMLRRAINDIRMATGEQWLTLRAAAECLRFNYDLPDGDTGIPRLSHLYSVFDDLDAKGSSAEIVSSILSDFKTHPAYNRVFVARPEPTPKAHTSDEQQNDVGMGAAKSGSLQLDEEATPAVDDEDVSILHALAKRPQLLQTQDTIAANSDVSRKTIAARIKDLLETRLVEQPKGPKRGTRITGKGLKFLKQLDDAKLTQ